MSEYTPPLLDPVSFDHQVPVEVSGTRFEPFETLGFLDVARLEKAERAEIEIGTVESGSCRNILRGVVEKGALTALTLHAAVGDAPCGEPDAEVTKLAQAARKALGREAEPARRLPVPVRELVANPRLTIETWTCVRICIFGFCFTCCWGENPSGTWSICAPSVVARS